MTRMTILYNLTLNLARMPTHAFSSGIGSWSLRLPTGTVPGLVGFDIGWNSGDNHISVISIGPLTEAAVEEGDYIALLKDRRLEGRPISGSVKFMELPEVAQHRVVSASRLRGEERLRIPHLTSSESFLLTGFYFIYESDDHNLLQFKVRQMAHNDHIYVNFGDNDGAEPYFAAISYAVVPSALVSQSILIDSRTGIRSDERFSRAPGNAVLQSFEFKFLNGDHKVQRVSIDLADDMIFARFRDKNGDDPFSWRAEFALIS